MSTDTAVENGLYEVGFHIVSSVAESEAPAELGKVTGIVAENGGTVKASEGPMLRGLAYDIVKPEHGRNIPHETAYFGSVVFEGSAETALAVKSEVAELPTVLRSFVIKVPQEALLPRERKVSGRIDAEKFRGDKSATPVEVSEEQLDKSIEKIVAE